MASALLTIRGSQVDNGVSFGEGKGILFRLGCIPLLA